MFHRLVYLSDAAPSFQVSELPQLLTVSRANNERDGLTGLMIFHERRFFQVLEGDMNAVMTCFNRIMRDPRHENLFMIETTAAQTRAFGQWRMAYEQVSDLPVELRQTVFSIYDMVPPNSEERGDDDTVRLRVRDFLASYEKLKISA